MGKHSLSSSSGHQPDKQGFGTYQIFNHLYLYKKPFWFRPVRSKSDFDGRSGVIVLSENFTDYWNWLRLPLKQVSVSNRKEWYLRSVGTSLRGSHNSPGGLQVASFRLLPGYGTILPSARATLCHCQAQNDTSGGRILQNCHLWFGIWFASRVRFACEKTTLYFTLHSSPNRLKPL